MIKNLLLVNIMFIINEEKGSCSILSFSFSSSYELKIQSCDFFFDI